MQTQQIHDCMRFRALHERQDYSLTPEFFQQHFDNGMRVFFGIELDDQGNIVQDTQNPKALKRFRLKR